MPVGKMDKRKMLLEELQALCVDLGIDFTKSSEELLDIIGAEEVIDYYFTRGPYPNFPDTTADIFTLTKENLYDYEIRAKGILSHILPLNQINSIAEGFTQRDEEDFLALYFRYGSLNSIVLQDRLTNKERVRKFSNTVKNKLTERLTKL